MREESRSDIEQYAFNIEMERAKEINPNYTVIIKFVIEAAKRLRERSGKIENLIGATKADVTEEDIIIERGLKDIITKFDGEQSLFAEEENAKFPNDTKDVWIADPISGTKAFKEGRENFAIVVSHMLNGQIQFAVVSKPASGDLYTAYANRGAFMNGQPIQVKKEGVETPRILCSASSEASRPLGERVLKRMKTDKEFEPVIEKGSVILNFCDVARGKVDGFFAFTKDSFPNFAGALLIREAGGKFTTVDGNEKFDQNDSMLVGGANDQICEKLRILIKDENEK